MAWNESGNGKNPWDRSGNEGPPDLDKIVRDWQRRFNSIFGGKGGGPSSSGGTNGPSGVAVVGIGVVVLIVWLFTGLYRVNADEVAFRRVCHSDTAGFALAPAVADRGGGKGGRHEREYDSSADAHVDGG